MAEFDPKKVIVSYGPVILGGVADGTFINVVRREDSHELQVGAYGDFLFITKNDKSGQVSATLLQSSLTNDALSGVIASQEAGLLGALPLTIKDLSGNSIYFSREAKILKPPDAGYGQTGENREWNFLCGSLQSFVGGNL